MKKTKIKKYHTTRKTDSTSLLGKLRLIGVFGIADAKQVGISQATLSRLVTTGKIERIGPGLYLHPKSSLPPEDRDFAVACARFGSNSAIGGLTALFHYNLIEQIPQCIWIIVPRTKQNRDPLYRIIRVKNNTPLGIETHGYYRITNLERTLVEAIRYSNKIGLRTAMRTIQKAILEKKTTLEKIMKMARLLKLENSVIKYWEPLLGGLEATT
jgi:predicted transcriptional regulator of viral defense system